MGSWDWDWINGDWMWDDGQYKIFGVDSKGFDLSSENIQALFHPEDVDDCSEAWAGFARGVKSHERNSHHPVRTARFAGVSEPRQLPR